MQEFDPGGEQQQALEEERAARRKEAEEARYAQQEAARVAAAAAAEAAEAELEALRRTFQSDLDDAERYLRRAGADYVEQLPETVVDAFDTTSFLRGPGPLESTADASLKTLLSGALASESAEPLIGSWVRDKIAGAAADWITTAAKNELVTKYLAEFAGDVQPMAVPDAVPDQDELNKAYEDLWRTANPRNLLKGVSPYLNRVVESFDKFSGLAFDPHRPEQ